MKIPIKKYILDETLSWEDRYKKLEAHHLEETSYLIERIKDMEVHTNSESVIPFSTVPVEKVGIVRRFHLLNRSIRDKIVEAIPNRGLIFWIWYGIERLVELRDHDEAIYRCENDPPPGVFVLTIGMVALSLAIAAHLIVRALWSPVWLFKKARPLIALVLFGKE